MYLLLITIPMGKRCFKIARIVVNPYSINMKAGFNTDNCIYGFGSILWCFSFGLIMAVVHFILGITLSIFSLCGASFACKHFALAQLALMPFGDELCDMAKIDESMSNDYCCIPESKPLKIGEKKQNSFTI